MGLKWILLTILVTGLPFKALGGRSEDQCRRVGVFEQSTLTLAFGDSSPVVIEPGMRLVAAGGRVRLMNSSKEVSAMSGPYCVVHNWDSSQHKVLKGTVSLQLAGSSHKELAERSVYMIGRKSKDRVRAMTDADINEPIRAANDQAIDRIGDQLSSPEKPFVYVYWNQLGGNRGFDQIRMVPSAPADPSSFDVTCYAPHKPSCDITVEEIASAFGHRATVNIDNSHVAPAVTVSADASLPLSGQ